MTVPDHAVPFAPPRLIKGGWQLAGGHGAIDRQAAIDDMFAFAEAGITAFDCADIYTGVEELIGTFLREWRAHHGAQAPAVRVHTKCVPDRDLLPSLQRRDIEALINRSLQRLRVETLDLVQFHWWDYAMPRWLDAAGYLNDLRQQGKIRHLGLTNFDTAHVTALHDAGIVIAAHQLQSSLLDRRALGAMATYCRTRGIHLLAYGALAGGFFHERWLDAPEPSTPHENRSLTKYHLIIDEFGGWAAFQSLLHTMQVIARAHDTTIGTVALRAVLDEPAISSAIVGARHAAHLPATTSALTLTLSDEERTRLRAHIERAPGPSGDVYALERDPHGPHAGIMRYNLNAKTGA